MSYFLHSLRIPCSLYTEDRHNGQLQIPPKRGAYEIFATLDKRNLAAAKSAIVLVTYFLIKLRYFLDLPKSVLVPRKIVPYLGFLSDSSRQVFHLIPDLEERKFFDLVQQTLTFLVLSGKRLQCLAGKRVSFSLAVQGTLFFAREMINAISKALRSK